MYNKNGLILLNRYKSGGTTSVSVNLSSGDTIHFADGTTTQTTPFLYYTTGTISTTQACQSLSKINITGLNYYLASAPNTDFTGAGLIPGYRSTPFDENTFTIASTTFSNYASVSSSYGIPTLAIVNNSASDIVVNNIDVAILMRNQDINTNKAVVIAGFSFPDVTIAVGESYTFTIMHKNS